MSEGPWKIMAILRPRTCRISSSERATQVLAVQDYFAGDDAGGRLGDDAQQGAGGHRLSAARLADDAQSLAFSQGEADAGQLLW